MLITLPDFDRATHFLSAWSKEIIDDAEKRAIKVLEVKEPNIIMKNVNSLLDKQKPQLVILNGHGTINKIEGQNKEWIIIRGKNHQKLRNKIVFARSCSAASGIGIELEGNNTGCFIGYQEDYAIIPDRHGMSRPNQNRSSKPFKESSNIIPLMLLAGKTANEAVEESKKIMENYLENQYMIDEDPRIFDVLAWNLSILTCVGNENATI